MEHLGRAIYTGVYDPGSPLDAYDVDLCGLARQANGTIKLTVPTTIQPATDPAAPGVVGQPQADGDEHNQPDQGKGEQWPGQADEGQDEQGRQRRLDRLRLRGRLERDDRIVGHALYRATREDRFKCN